MAIATSMRYLDWGFAAGAVLRVIQDHKTNPARWKADADTWANYSEGRQEVFEAARQQWVALSGYDVSYFPLSVDAVARLYFRFRKRNDQELAAFAVEIDARVASKAPKSKPKPK